LIFLNTKFLFGVKVGPMKTLLLILATQAVFCSAASAAKKETVPAMPSDIQLNIWDDFKTYENTENSQTSTDKGIYGEDNRRLVSELDSGEELKEMSRAVLAQVPRWRVTEEDKTSYTIATKNLEKGMNFCPDEKFASLPLVSSCSAFLIGEDLLLTAGHCLKDKFDCQKNFWVLDYEDELGFSAGVSKVKIDKEKVVTCDKLISIQENSKFDYALMKINRKVSDRKPLTIRKLGKVNSDANLAVIGHPMGLPKIIASEAKIRTNHLPYTFLTNADTFSGNSGSPVINMETHQVEGILIRGDSDFQMDLDLGCNRAYHCSNNECKGETVMRTTELPFKFFPRF